jgi:hypothetical protein
MLLTYLILLREMLLSILKCLSPSIFFVFLFKKQVDVNVPHRQEC